jgi:glutathione S-transferase
MALTIYGTARSRTMRVLWMAAELGLDYRHVPLTDDDPFLKSDRFLALNPAGTVPVIDDEGVVVSESLAINLHLARRYGAAGASPFYPASDADLAAVWRWTLFAQGELEPFIMRDERAAALRAAAGAEMSALAARALKILERALEDRDWLVAGRFTVADLNVAAVLSPSRTATLDLAPYRRLSAWLAACYSRPAAVATRERYG